MTPWARVSEEEYSALSLRAHEVLRDAPVHDVWRVFLPGKAPCTMADVRAVAAQARETQRPAVVVRALFAIRYGVGRLCGWDRPPAASESRSYRARLSDSDRESSLVPPGTRDGPFEVLYVHTAEALSEIQNATAHAFLVWALRPKSGGHDLYWAVHVLPVGAGTRLYMGLIDPFRRWLVYPSLLRQYHEAWVRHAAHANQ